MCNSVVDSLMLRLRDTSACDLAWAGDINTLSLLNEIFPPKMHQRIGGKTLVHYAAQGGQDEVIIYLYECKILRIYSKDLQGKLPLDYAISCKHKSTETLLRNLMTMSWSPESHHIFPQTFQRGVLHILGLAMALNAQRQTDEKDYMRIEIWYQIIAYLPRDWGIY